MPEENKNPQIDVDVLRRLENQTQKIEGLVRARGEQVSKRYPLTFALLGTLGIASVIYGFEKTVDTIPVLNQHPTLILIIGIALLVFTGTLYKRLKGN